MLEKDDTPPGWFASWGLMTLGLILLTAPASARVRRRK